MPTATAELTPLPQLHDPANYQLPSWDLLADLADARHWINVIEQQNASIRTEARASGYAPDAIESAIEAIVCELNLFRETPDRFGCLSIPLLDERRDAILREHGIQDVYRALKERETTAAETQLADRLAFLDSLSGEAQRESLFRGVFAGNLFDMGAQETAAWFTDGQSPPFEVFLQKVHSRPWFFDGLDALQIEGHRKAVLFVDNAGSDVVLGMLPLARALCQSGAEVVLAANTKPALNDITAEELEGVVERAPAICELRDAGKLRVVASGSAAPYVDLVRISPELQEAAHDADLVVLEGMARSLESNWEATFTCETWRLAVVKETSMAKRFGTDLFNCVLRVEPPHKEYP